MPDWKSLVRARVAPLPLDAAREADIVDELAQHVAEDCAERLANGAEEADALAMALAPLADHDCVAEDIARAERPRPAAPVPPVDRTRLHFDVARDVRYAVRLMRRTPGFTAVVLVTIALGIGANTAIFAIVDAVLFKPLPVAAPARLVDVFTSDFGGTTDFSTSSYPDYLDLKAQNDVFDGVVGYSPMIAALTLDNRSRMVTGEIVTGNYFQVFGVGAALGRTIIPSDDVPGAPRVVMVSHRYWARALGSAPDAIGRAVRIRGRAYTIVGVAPASFTGMVPVLSPEMWLPVSVSIEVDPVGWSETLPAPVGTTRLDRRGDRWMFIRARLKPGKTIEEARANLSLLMTRISADNPATNRNRHLSLKPTSQVHLRPSLDRVIVPVAAGLMAAVGLVLLIACANVASMLLARTSSRQKEIGIRLAMGASRGRLVQQLVTEAVVMSLLGALGGLLIAWGATSAQVMRWATSALASLSLPLPYPLVFDLHIDGRVLAFTVGTTLLTGLLAGLVPAIQASKPNLVADLRGETVGSPVAGRRWALGDLLVAGQMAVTALLLVVAALLTRSFFAAQRTNPGFAVSHLAVVSTNTRMLRYTSAQSEQFYDEAIAKVSALPGVESVALVSRVPLQLNKSTWEIWIPDRHKPGDPGDTVQATTVSPGFFKTIGVAIVEGRAFTDADRPDTPLVAIVNETLARRYWPGQSAIGKVFHIMGREGPAFQIVGVSADHKVLTLSEPPTPFLHISRIQRPNSYAAIVARTRDDAAVLLRDMRRELLTLDPNVVFVENQTMETQVDATLFPMRVTAWLVSGVGLVATLLAAIGLYSVIAYSVARRTKEIGIRLALGARPGAVVGLVMREGLLVASAGLVAGCLLTAVAARAIAGVLYGVTAADPVSWLAPVVVLVGTSALATLIPAWRAARVDPLDALRIE